MPRTAPSSILLARSWQERVGEGNRAVRLPFVMSDFALGASSRASYLYALEAVIEDYINFP